MERYERDAARLRRATSRALVGGLCIAAAVAVVALMSGSFDDTDWRVVVTSLAFSVFSATAAAGAGLRLARRARPLAAATIASAAVAFGLLLVAVWAVDDTLDAEGIWRAFGVAALVSLWTSHASLVVHAKRPSDTRVIRALGAASISALGLDASVAILALLGALRDAPDELFTRGLAALLVVALLTTALPPLLRRAARRPPLPDGSPTVEEELVESVERLSAMDLPVGARVELLRLRDLVRRI